MNRALRIGLVTQCLLLFACTLISDGGQMWRSYALLLAIWNAVYFALLFLGITRLEGFYRLAPWALLPGAALLLELQSRATPL